MALSIKGLQYFPLDVNFFENNKIAIIISDYGLEATAVVLKLFSQIYKSGYYMDWNEKIGKIFSTSFHTKYSYATIMNLVNSLVEEDIFNKKMYEQYHILTSEKIQNCYFTATVRRKKQKISNPEYLLIADMIPSSTTPKEHLNDNSADKNPKNACNFEQSIVDESKVKESRENLIISSSCLTRAGENFETIEMKSPFIQECEQKRKELFADEEWLYSISMMSGKGHQVLDLLPQVMRIFEMHLISIGDTGTILNINDYKRRFQNWWRCLNFGSAQEIMEQNPKKECSAPRTTQKTSKIEEAMAVAERASEMAYQLMQQNPL